MIIIQTTVDDDKIAKELINLLVETNKIACGIFMKSNLLINGKKN